MFSLDLIQRLRMHLKYYRSWWGEWCQSSWGLQLQMDHRNPCKIKEIHLEKVNTISITHRHSCFNLCYKKNIRIYFFSRHRKFTCLQWFIQSSFLNTQNSTQNQSKTEMVKQVTFGNLLTHYKIGFLGYIRNIHLKLCPCRKMSSHNSTQVEFF